LPAEPPAGRGRRVAPVIVAVVLIAVGALVTVPILLLRGNDGSAPPDVKAGWKRVAPAGQGFSVYLPPQWNSVSTKSADDAFNSLNAANPQLANLVKDQLGASLSALIKLLAFDTQSPTLAQQFATNMNVVVAPTGSNISFDQFLQLNVEQLRQTPGLAGLRQERVGLPAGESAIVSSQLTVNAPGGGQTVAITQYLLVSEARGYIISFSTLPANVAGYSPLFREIAETFRYV
jgi:hypothetical protein